MPNLKTNNKNKQTSSVRNALYSYSAEGNDVENENRLLRETVVQLKTELTKLRTPPLMVAEIIEVIDNSALIQIPNGNRFFVYLSPGLKDLKPSDAVLVEQKNLNVIKKINSNKRFNVEQFVILEKPTVTFKDVGGLKFEEQEIKEVIELPLKKPELFKKIGIKPPKGVLLYGPPGTGKTLLAKAVANSTNSTFIQIVGSELVQKFIGEGAKLVKEIFQLAREKAPSIVFIDELDSLAATRMEIGTSGEREVQRTFMQLLSEIDGFNNLDNVKIIGCTNRKDILDPAIMRPGRLDRLILVDNPDNEGLKEIFKIHSRNMKFTKSIDIDKIHKKLEGLSGAEVHAICTEAGYFAIRDSKTVISMKHFLDAIEKVKQAEEDDANYVKMFG
jgi:proteasome regulatory subunit